MDKFNCDLHTGVTLERGGTESCADCVALMQRDVEGMSGDERGDELAGWFASRLTVPFPDLHERIEKLVGRPVWTHEMGLAGERLIEEARGARPQADMGEVLSELTDLKKFVAIVSPPDA